MPVPRPRRAVSSLPACVLAAARACLGSAAHAADIKQGAAIVSQGVPPSVLACATCHGAKGEGGPGFPPLAGLSPAYIKEQIAAWKNGTRDPGPLALMGEIAKRLSDSDVDAITQYYASQQTQQ